MRTLTGIVLMGGIVLGVSYATAQRPGDGDDLVARMLGFDKDRDGKLTKAEVTDARLLRLFDRADADKDGVVTEGELAALAAREKSDDRGGPPGFGPPGGFPMGPPPRPGEILPPMLQRRLALSPEQKAQLDALQKEVDARLETILDDAQKAQLKELRERRPGGFGPPGGGGRRRGGGRPEGEGTPAPPDRTR